MPRKGKDTTDQKIGGIPFFLSLFFLLVLALINAVQLPRLLLSTGDDPLTQISRWQILLCLLIFGIGTLLGAVAAVFLIPSRMAVFVHELKHSIVSNLAGNKFKAMKIGRESGHFEYKYSKATAAYNAFIALAPYYLPLFTAAGALMAASLFWHKHTAMVTLIALAYGADCALNARDVSPHQSDFSNLRGGFRVGLVYVLAMNGTILTFLLAWAMRGWEGWQLMLQGLWSFLYGFYAS